MQNPINEIINNRIISVIRAEEPKEAIEKATGTYGRFEEAVKKIDPREE